MMMLSLDDANNKWVWCCSLVAQEDLPAYFEPEFLIASTKPWN